MASVATELSRRGWAVSGSDSQFYPPMGDLLARSTVVSYTGFLPEHLPNEGIVVVGNAVSRGNPELEAALDRNLPLISLPELIRWI
jgi:UDP-N-acetylmuramate: L-alanyl-gamma-D-glutamyl-meso-diaminopimelate ligase